MSCSVIPRRMDSRKGRKGIQIVQLLSILYNGNSQHISRQFTRKCISILCKYSLINLSVNFTICHLYCLSSKGHGGGGCSGWLLGGAGVCRMAVAQRYSCWLLTWKSMVQFQLPRAFCCCVVEQETSPNGVGQTRWCQCSAASLLSV